MIHDILQQVLLLLQEWMEDGINMLCPNGKHRLCVPVIAEYIADYEEQRLLANILRGFCPKCTIPVYRTNNKEKNDSDDNREYGDIDEQQIHRHLGYTFAWSDDGLLNGAN